MAYVMVGSDISRACLETPSASFDWMSCDLCGDDYGIHKQLIFDNPPGSSAGWKVQQCNRSGRLDT